VLAKCQTEAAAVPPLAPRPSRFSQESRPCSPERECGLGFVLASCSTEAAASAAARYLAVVRSLFRKKLKEIIAAAQLASQADAAPFVGPAAGPPRIVPTGIGVTPAAVRSSRVCVRRGGWRAAVRSARKRAAQLRRNVLGGWNSDVVFCSCVSGFSAYRALHEHILEIPVRQNQ
jgi:hypothetical protein